MPTVPIAVTHFSVPFERPQMWDASSAAAFSSHKTPVEGLTSLQVHLNFKVKKIRSLSLRYLLYFALQDVEECDVKWAVWQTYLQFIWLRRNQYNNGVPLGKQADKRSWQYAVLWNTLWICWTLPLKRSAFSDSTVKFNVHSTLFPEIFLSFSGYGHTEKIVWGISLLVFFSAWINSNFFWSSAFRRKVFLK